MQMKIQILDNTGRTYQAEIEKTTLSNTKKFKFVRAVLCGLEKEYIIFYFISFCDILELLGFEETLKSSAQLWLSLSFDVSLP